jgi:hypothetical protein
MEDQPRAHHVHAHVQVFTLATDAAITSLKRAVELDGEVRDYWDFLGELCRKAGRSQEFRTLLSAYDSSASADNASTNVPGEADARTP